MSPALVALLEGSRSQVALLDSNLLALYITATYDPRLIRLFKRTQMFTQEDAFLLAWLLGQFAGVVTTAHILTETSNLGNSLSSVARDGWFSRLAEFAYETREESVSCKELSQAAEFRRFGLTDTAISLCSSKYTIVTADGRLAAYLANRDGLILSFEDLKHLL